MNIKILISLSLLAFFFSCTPDGYLSSPPTCNIGQKFASFEDANNEAYQQLALAEIKNKTSDNYYYFFKTFIEEGANTYMLTNFRNEKDCFDVKMLVDKWDKLEGMKRVNGKAYPKQLVNLQWKIDQQGQSEQVVYVDMNTIID